VIASHVLFFQRSVTQARSGSVSAFLYDFKLPDVSRQRNCPVVGALIGPGFNFTSFPVFEHQAVIASVFVDLFCPKAFDQTT
jgi:hypothetical protein